MRKVLLGTLAMALAAVGCTDSVVEPTGGLDATNIDAPMPFSVATQGFVYPTSVVDSDQGNRMFIPTVGFTPVMDGGACNDGTCASEADRSTASAVLSPFDDEWFSLGLDVGDPAPGSEGFVTVDFGVGVTGQIAVVFEQTFETATYPEETADVYGSNDLTTWDLLGTVGNDGTNDPECGESCTYEILPAANMCYRYVMVENATAAADYNSLDYVAGGEVSFTPGDADYPGNDLIPDGFDVQAIAFEEECVEEVGCTRTQGYWQTHNDEFQGLGGPPSDPTWELLSSGTDTEFFDSGESYYDVLAAPVKGNKALILAHQYIAAELNVLAGASMPSDVQDAFDDATDYFTANATGDSFPVVKGGGTLATELVELSELLDSYNMGLEGVPHCDTLEEEEE